MRMKKVKFINMENFEESDHNVCIYKSELYRYMYIEVEINGVHYRSALRKGCEISPSYYPKKFEKFFSCDHTIVEYKIFLWNSELQQDDYEVIIYADLGQEDPANPDPEKILFIENEEELKKYIADLIYEEENPWWDREKG